MGLEPVTSAMLMQCSYQLNYQANCMGAVKLY